jgi:hypothetical protein
MIPAINISEPDMHTLEVPDKNKTILIPEHWDECTKREVNDLFCRALHVALDNVTMYDYYLYALKRLDIFNPGLKVSIHSKVLGERWRQQYFSAIYFYASKTLSWAFKTNKDGRMELNYNTVRQNLPMIQVGRKKLYGPSDLLEDLTFGEFRNAKAELDKHYLFAKDPETRAESEEAMDAFMACLYRPAERRAKEANDNPKSRAPFNAKHINTRYTRKIPMWKKMQVMLWFTYCISYIQTEDLLLDGNEINFSPIFPKSLDDDKEREVKLNSRGTGWTGLLHSVAKEGVFGDAEKTDQTLLFDVLLYMYKNHLDNIKIQQQQKRKSS